MYLNASTEMESVVPVPGLVRAGGMIAVYKAGPEPLNASTSISPEAQKM